MKMPYRFALIASIAVALCATAVKAQYSLSWIQYYPMGPQSELFGGLGSLPTGTQIGPDAFNFTIVMPQPMTLTGIQPGSDVWMGFGLQGLNPTVNANEVGFTFDLTLLRNGAVVSPTYSQSVIEDYSFYSIGLGFTAPFGQMTFDTVNVSVTSPVVRDVSGFELDGSIVRAEAVPEDGSIAGLLLLGMVLVIPAIRITGVALRK